MKTKYKIIKYPAVILLSILLYILYNNTFYLLLYSISTLYLLYSCYIMDELELALNSLTLENMEEYNATNNVFTRYLFVKQNVYWSLLLSIINKSKEESLYWTYELYYSGFQKELMLFLMNIFNVFYKNTTSVKFKTIITYKLNLWLSKNNESIIGSIVYNLCNKNADIESFFNNCSATVYYDNNMTNNHLFVNLSSDSILEYKDIDCYAPDYKTWKVLGLTTKYRSQSITSEIYNSINNINNSTDYIKKLLLPVYTKPEYIEIIKNMNNVLLNMYNTPIWKNRFDKFGAKLVSNPNKKIKNINGDLIPEITVEFPNEDLYEEFCNLYWYEPDENITAFIESRL